MNIWKNFEFTRFFASYTIGNIGDWFDVFALQIIFVHLWHASPIIMSLLILFYFLPAILLGPIAGILADRVSKRDLMIYTDGFAALLTIGIYFSNSVPMALTLLFLRSCFVSFNSPAQQSYVKHVVTDEQLLKASSYTTVVFQMCKVFGPMLGAAILLIASARTCLLINAMSFIFSVMILMSLPKDKVSTDEEKELKKKHWVGEIGLGVKYIWGSYLMRVTIMVVMIWFFCSLIVQTQLAIFLQHLLPGKQDALGLFMGFDGLGAVITSTLLSRKAEIKNFYFYFFLGFILLGLGILGTSNYHAGWPHYILYLFAILIGLGSGIQLVNYSYIIKKGTPNNQIGRVTGLVSALQNTVLTLGTLSSGFLVLQLGVREVYFGLAVVMFLLAIGSIIFMPKKEHIFA